MSFGDDLYEQFIIETRRIGGAVHEVELLRALLRAFNNMAALGMADCEEIHGRRHQVRFSEITGNDFYYITDRGNEVSCELADLLFVTVDPHEMRICCMQNKYEKNRIGLPITNSFEADMRQLYLLKNRPVFHRNHSSFSILQDAKCHSVGSYGVFYEDGVGYNMNYFSADVLNERTNASGRRRKAIMLNVIAKEVVRGVYPETAVECQYSENIIDFGDNLLGMMIGTPLSVEDGLTVLGDMNIMEAVARLIPLNPDTITSLRRAISNGNPSIPYRAAIVLRGQREG